MIYFHFERVRTEKSRWPGLRCYLEDFEDLKLQVIKLQKYFTFRNVYKIQGQARSVMSSLNIQHGKATLQKLLHLTRTLNTTCLNLCIMYWSKIQIIRPLASGIHWFDLLSCMYLSFFMIDAGLQGGLRTEAKTVYCPAAPGVCKGSRQYTVLQSHREDFHKDSILSSGVQKVNSKSSYYQSNGLLGNWK